MNVNQISAINIYTKFNNLEVKLYSTPEKPKEYEEKWYNSPYKPPYYFPQLGLLIDTYI